MGGGRGGGAKALAGRASLMHDGTLISGQLDMTDVVAGERSSYDAELAPRIDVLAQLQDARLLYVFDCTSPLLGRGEGSAGRKVGSPIIRSKREAVRLISVVVYVMHVKVLRVNSFTFGR